MRLILLWTARILLWTVALLLAAVVYLSQPRGTGGGSGGGGKKPSALVGHWVCYDDATNCAPDMLILVEDGTGTHYSMNNRGMIYKWIIGGVRHVVRHDPRRVGICITWAVKKKRLVLLAVNHSCNEITVDYNVSGNELTLAADSARVTLVREEYFEEYKKKREGERKKEIEKNTVYFTDSRDGRVYRAVKIGAMTWMAENLNYQTGNSWCLGDSASGCDKYGRVYDWETAKLACPSGWYLPTRQDWVDLTTAAGGITAGAALKSADGDWNPDGEELKDGGCGKGTDAYGFSALPGYSRSPNGTFSAPGYYGNWWTATEECVDSCAYSVSMSCDTYYLYASKRDRSRKSNGYPVRCVMGNPAPPEKTQSDMNATGESGAFTDERDGRIYKTVKIGGKTWVAENLRYKANTSWCYNDDSTNCDTYGRLYDWNTAAGSAANPSAARGVCPVGWHLPSREEWGDLAKTAGGAYGKNGAAGAALKAAAGWLRKITPESCGVCGDGTDDYGFSALPGGYRDMHGEFRNVRGIICQGRWWTATEADSRNAYYRAMRNYSDDVSDNYDGKGAGFSVRCVEDAE